VFEDGSSVSTTTIKKWAETRWDSRWTSIQSIIENYKALDNSLEELADERTERSTDARGLLFAIREPVFVVTLFILQLLFGKVKILSDQLKCELFSRDKRDFGCLRSLLRTAFFFVSFQ
jgi:hypothetical protein